MTDVMKFLRENAGDWPKQRECILAADWSHPYTREQAAFPLPFVAAEAPIALKGQARMGPTFREAVLMHSIGRIAYHGHIDNIQASWVKIGRPGVRQLLKSGVNDLGGTLMNENISRAAGASHGQGLERRDFEEIIDGMGRRLEQRTTRYGRVQAAV